MFIYMLSVLLLLNTLGQTMGIITILWLSLFCSALSYISRIFTILIAIILSVYCISSIFLYFNFYSFWNLTFISTLLLSNTKEASEFLSFYFILSPYKYHILGLSTLLLLYTIIFLKYEKYINKIIGKVTSSTYYRAYGFLRKIIFLIYTKTAYRKIVLTLFLVIFGIIFYNINSVYKLKS